ncbi:phosphatidate cytidylyltransferase [Chelativorans sp. M5D2P16]|uniref:phosphatidate cytidylyltransferase n=1 Tax=Chelativorans sp. M5D2P16 TaxID=3095678 RepID=UPI002ACA9AE3|nr:phosphatidate cytidylyltransferase [Chelativorans sp. M5D2P16]MDZ5696407.1 phosphatidate cytidylyltransferase [Chelativorans sp. M5D2P16]
MSSRKAGSELGLRIASALVLGVLVLGITVLGGGAFRLFAAVMAMLVFHEWMAMRTSGHPTNRLVAWVLLAAVMLAMLVGLSAPLSLAALGAAFAVVAAHAMFSGSSGWSAAGLIYAGLPAIALAFLRVADTAGLMAILFLFAVVWATDVAAFFVGRALGGPRLAPAISPGKTWSGAIGGALGGLAAGLAVAGFDSGGPALLWGGLVALALSVVSQAGDLFESALKRRHGVKDSGRLIPGHGGVMDRVDGLVAAALLFYLLGALLSGPNTPAAAFFSR